MRTIFEASKERKDEIESEIIRLQKSDCDKFLQRTKHRTNTNNWTMRNTEREARQGHKTKGNADSTVEIRFPSSYEFSSGQVDKARDPPLFLDYKLQRS